jgi:hypothetical protein
VCVAHCRYPIYLTRGGNKVFSNPKWPRLPLSSSPQQIQDILPVKPPQAPVYALSNQKLLSAGQRNKHSAFRTKPITLLFRTNQSQNQPITQLSEPYQSLCFSDPTNHSAFRTNQSLSFQNQPITQLSEPNQSFHFSESTNHSAFQNQPITPLFRQNKHNVWSNGSTPLSGQIKKMRSLEPNKTFISRDQSNTLHSMD